MVTLTTGNEFTVNVTLPVLEHPAELVPVTLYTVDAEGEAVNEVPLPDGLQVYVFPPDPEIVELCPMQTVDGLAVAVMVGTGFTVRTTLAVPLQPAAEVPVT